jgi:hypothetical protein
VVEVGVSGVEHSAGAAADDVASDLLERDAGA